MSPESPITSRPREAFVKPEMLRSGALVLHLREKLGVTQYFLASETGLNQGVISEIEQADSDNRQIGYVTILKLARAVGAGINFWEKGLVDSKVFMVPQARIVKDFMDSDTTSNLKQILSQYLETLPQLEHPDLTYLDYAPTNKELKDKLKERRKELGLTQYQVANSVQTSQGYISQLEGATEVPVKNPPINKITQLAEALKLDIYELADLQDISPPPWVVDIDTFFRAETIPPKTKKLVWQVISSLIEQARDPFLNPDIPETPSSRIFI